MTRGERRRSRLLRISRRKLFVSPARQWVRVCQLGPWGGQPGRLGVRYRPFGGAMDPFRTQFARVNGVCDLKSKSYKYETVCVECSTLVLIHRLHDA